MSQPANDIGSAGLEVENTDMSGCEIAANDIVKLTHDKLSTEEVSASVVCPSCGAVSLFIGITRNSFEGKKVVELEYEAYIPMAQSEMKKICWDVRLKWPSVKHIAIHHRLGVVPVSEASVIIAISSPHRSESLEAVKYCIDTLKATVPIWKKEIYETEDCSWKENKECRWAGSREK
ncbi:molybdopterin synthase catalytic subunit-like isoform X1 [Acipenser oxyrinchus oxyrinchus]|uniref:Molybdopterin synthase catalytic subunit n=1 Tax=Acipenser oxyrinchus oxyrinchus TaxID=40147 RepID=A0AAD8CH94_ACIOX|nr:molybdopterin synthase catalytic subunit-like isoform X1 [Acipenser oxyrinchus oxyrinchus]